MVIENRANYCFCNNSKMLFVMNKPEGQKYKHKSLLNISSTNFNF